MDFSDISIEAEAIFLGTGLSELGFLGLTDFSDISIEAEALL
jgi:hypothetical protein